MHDILVKQDFTDHDVKMADLNRSQFKPSRATSGASNVLDMADLGKTVMLCDDHVRQFATKPVLLKYGYRRHDDYPVVMGNCDHCRIFGKCTLFQHLSVFGEVLRTKAQRRADYEYGQFVAS